MSAWYGVSVAYTKWTTATAARTMDFWQEASSSHPWHGPTTLPGPGFSGNPAFIQGHFGRKGNFGLVFVWLMEMVLLSILMIIPLHIFAANPSDSGWAPEWNGNSRQESNNFTPVQETTGPDWNDICNKVLRHLLKVQYPTDW
jgi:hypothetical protein